jgi:UDP-2,3-diacylglucosamine pyrophosphatase LpxH
MDPESPIIILSDIHLGSDMARADALSHFLETAEFGTLILNGDVLDNPNMRFLTPSHWKLLDRIKKSRHREKRLFGFQEITTFSLGTSLKQWG